MFAHLHCHFWGSYSDSILSFSAGLDRVQKTGQRAVAITDHGELAFVPGFVKECVFRGLHPVIGCEFYFVDNALESIARGDNSRFHLVILAKNAEGWKNLIALNNSAWMEHCFKGVRGLLDWSLLERYHQGLIALSGCFWGSLPQRCIREGIEAGRRELYRYLDIFGDDFHPEVQRHGIEDEEKANRMLSELSRQCSLKPVVTNDCHYEKREHWRIHDALIKTRFGKPSNFALSAQDYFLRTEEEMSRLGFPRQWLLNSYEVAVSCQVPPDIMIPGSISSDHQSGGKIYAARHLAITPSRALSNAGAVLGRELDKLEDYKNVFRSGCEQQKAWDEIKDSDPDLFFLASGLTGAYRGSVPDFKKPCLPGLPKLRTIFPLKRSRGKIIIQYPFEEIKEVKGLWASFSDPSS